MVNSKEATEGDYISVALINSAQNKNSVVIDPGDYEKTDFGRRLTIGVNIEGKIKRYRPNKESVLNLQVLGLDTMQWVGKIINFSVEKRLGKDCVIAKLAKVE
jgi:hypothetical protein